MNTEITREDTAAGGRYVARIPDEDAVAELTYRRDGDVLVAERTYVPDKVRGRGIASRLVERLVSDAREEGTTIEPVCSFVASKFSENGESWSDVRATV